MGKYPILHLDRNWTKSITHTLKWVWNDPYPATEQCSLLLSINTTSKYESH